MIRKFSDFNLIIWFYYTINLYNYCLLLVEIGSFLLILWPSWILPNFFVVNAFSNTGKQGWYFYFWSMLHEDCISTLYRILFLKNYLKAISKSEIWYNSTYCFLFIFLFLEFFKFLKIYFSSTFYFPSFFSKKFKWARRNKGKKFLVSKDIPKFFLIFLLFPRFSLTLCAFLFWIPIKSLLRFFYIFPI